MAESIVRASTMGPGRRDQRADHHGEPLPEHRRRRRTRARAERGDRGARRQHALQVTADPRSRTSRQSRDMGRQTLVRIGATLYEAAPSAMEHPAADALIGERAPAAPARRPAHRDDAPVAVALVARDHPGDALAKRQGGRGTTSPSLVDSGAPMPWSRMRSGPIPSVSPSVTVRTVSVTGPRQYRGSRRKLPLDRGRAQPMSSAVHGVQATRGLRSGGGAERPESARRDPACKSGPGGGPHRPRRTDAPRPGREESSKSPDYQCDDVAYPGEEGRMCQHPKKVSGSHTCEYSYHFPAIKGRVRRLNIGSYVLVRVSVRTGFLGA